MTEWRRRALIAAVGPGTTGASSGEVTQFPEYQISEYQSGYNPALGILSTFQVGIRELCNLPTHMLEPAEEPPLHSVLESV